MPLQETGELTTYTLARLSQAASPGEWEKYPGQRSAPLMLKAGQRVLLEATSTNAAATGVLQVGVRVPGSGPR